MSLLQSQQRFQDYLLRTTGVAEDLVLADARADAVTRLGVYVDAYRLRLIEVLGSDYPALCALAGAGPFERIARAYIEAHPSDTPSVRWFGRHLPQFLEQSPGFARHQLLAELAAFEWAKGAVFDAPEAPALELAAVAAVQPESWPEMRLLTHPALRRIDLRWNVTELSQAHEAQRALPAPQQAQEPVRWLLWRDAELEIRWRSLAGDEAAAFDAMQAGASFGEICERLCEFVEAEEAAMHAAGLLKRWIVDGLMTEVEGV